MQVRSVEAYCVFDVLHAFSQNKVEKYLLQPVCNKCCLSTLNWNTECLHCFSLNNFLSFPEVCGVRWHILHPVEGRSFCLGYRWILVPVERLYCKRPIQCLASSKILTPPPPSTPSRPGGGPYSLGGEGGGESIFWKAPDTALYSTYVSTLCLYQCSQFTFIFTRIHQSFFL